MKVLGVLASCLVLVLANESEDFAAGERIFSADVYQEVLLNNKDNILISPFSADTILALTQSGAVGATGEQLRTALHLPSTNEETEAEFKSVLPTIHSDQYVLKTANKIYVENNFEIKPDFRQIAVDVYEASIEAVEFQENVDTAAEINQWVAEQTNNKITDLVSPDSLNADTRVVLVNALYFQGNWTSPFIPLKTRTASFYTSESQTVDATVMYDESRRTNYYESEQLDAQILQLPFLGDTASMTFVLPNKKEGIAILEKQISAAISTFDYVEEDVEIFLPKFTIETTIDFKQVLQGLGVQTPFDPLQADFSGIAGVKGDLFIGNAVQKTYIDVNELGVAAAAATDIGEPDAVQPPKTKTFNADHPFVFFIAANDIILFEGRVLVPNYDN